MQKILLLLTIMCTLHPGPSCAQPGRQGPPYSRSYSKTDRSVDQGRDSSWWAYRLFISVNPAEVFESPDMAFGAGIGLRLAKRVELFSETAYLAGGDGYFASPLSGFREIFKVRYYTQKNIGGGFEKSSRGHSPVRSTFFIGLDIRYKQYKYGDVNSFANGVLHDTITGVPFQSRHHFWGIGAEIGYRTPLNRNGSLQAELTIGAGIKFKTIDRVGPPPGYKYLGTDTKIDYGARSYMETDGILPYFPAALRILWCFGKMKRSG